MKHFFRITALLLAVLLVALPPLQASAAVATGTAVMIGLGAAAVVGSVMVGLGVMPGSDRSAFDTIVQSCTESSSVGAYIRDGLIDVLRYKNSGCAVRYGILQNLIEAVRGWLFDQDVVSVADRSPSVTSYTYSYNNRSTTFTSDKPFSIFYFDSVSNGSPNYCIVFYSTSSCSVTTSTGKTYNLSDSVTVDGTRYYCYMLLSGAVNYPITIPFYSGYSGARPSTASARASILAGYFNSLSSPYDVSLGDVAAPSDDLTSSYADWSAGSIALPHPGIDIPGVDEGTDEGTGEDTGEEEGEEEGEQEKEKKLVYWPTGILNPATDTTDVLTQENVIAGNGTLDDTLTGDITGPIVGGITGDITLEDTPAIPGEGEDVGTGEGEGTGDIVYPTDIPTYSLDLREFFPFCIPFDIYEFLSILAADPVAPVFEWSIPVPQLGESFDLEVDLSAWDNVARLFRNLELLAFIVGLAMVTRDKFIRS